MAARRLSISVVLVTVVVAVLASPASAGGSHLYPVRDRSEPGEAATLVGYIGRGQLGWVENGPFYAYLVTGSDQTLGEAPHEPRAGTRLGPLTIEETGAGGYLSLRISITFTIPPELAPGPYAVSYCNDPCDQGIGDLIGGSVYVGVDPPSPITPREWALDEPEIANLADEALLAGPGFELTAAEIRAGHLPPSSSELYAFGGAPTTTTGAPPVRTQNSAAPIRANNDDASWIASDAPVFALTVLMLVGMWLALRARRRLARVRGAAAGTAPKNYT